MTFKAVIAQPVTFHRHRQARLRSTATVPSWDVHAQPHEYRNRGGIVHTIALLIGTHTITAQYSGDATYAQYPNEYADHHQRVALLDNNHVGLSLNPATVGGP